MCERVSTRLRFTDGAVEAVRYEDDPERSTGRFDFVDLMVRRLNLFVPDARGLWLRSLVVDALLPPSNCLRVRKERRKKKTVGFFWSLGMVLGRPFFALRKN